MGIKQNEFIMPALGRPAFLGQLYNASSEQLLNTQFFASDTLDKTQDVANSFNSVDFKDVSSVSERAQALDISAELSVSLMGGMIDLKGSGQYLDTSKSNVSSREVTMICLTRIKLQRLNITPQTFKKLPSPDPKLGATHVVTGIVYGGRLVANIIEKASGNDTQTKVHGEFSAAIAKGSFSASGKVSADFNKELKESMEDRDFKVYGDYSSTDEQNPTTIGAVFELAQKWQSTVKGGVPVDITLTPVSQFVDNSNETRLIHELGADELANILSQYDELYLLAGRRSRIVAVLEEGKLAQFFPTFTKVCRQRKSVIDGILGKSRKALAEYLVNFRDGSTKDTADVFLQTVKEGYFDYLKQCEDDESTLSLLASVKLLADDRKVPLATINDLRGLMTKAARGAIGVVLIPPSPNTDSAVNAYDGLVKDIRNWRADEDKKDLDAEGKPKTTTFYSFFCDISTHAELLKLDGAKGALKKGLDQAVEESDSRFVYYGEVASTSTQKRFDWSLLNEEGWAFLNDQEEGWSYIGQVSGGQRHGRGNITYVDGSTYTGSWWKGKRHGQGELVEDGTHTAGVFVDDTFREDGLLVTLTIVGSNKAPIATYKVPLRKYDSTTSHVLRIGAMLGWTDADEYKVIVQSKTKAFSPIELVIIGRLLKPGYEDFASISWPFDKGTIDLKASKNT